MKAEEEKQSIMDVEKQSIMTWNLRLMEKQPIMTWNLRRAAQVHVDAKAFELD